jgi:hypothetical protein
MPTVFGGICGAGSPTTGCPTGPTSIRSTFPNCWRACGCLTCGTSRSISPTGCAGRGRPSRWGAIRRDAHSSTCIANGSRTRRTTWRRGPLAFRHRAPHKEVENLMVPMTEGGTRVAILLCYSHVFRADGTLY